MQLFPSLSKCFGSADLDQGGCGWNELSGIASELLKNLMIVGIAIAVGMIMYAGYILVKEQGSSDSRSRVRKIFINIFIGVFLLVGAYFIVEFVLDTLNVKKEYREDALPKR